MSCARRYRGVASGRLRAFPDGVAFVNLAPIGNPDLVHDTIAGTLGLRDMGTASLHDRLIDVLADMRLLLVLDNFEQVVTAAPGLGDILGVCPGVTLLITSRISLRLSGERAQARRALSPRRCHRVPGKTTGVTPVFSSPRYW
jgi:predicted ATPase